MNRAELLRRLREDDLTNIMLQLNNLRLYLETMYDDHLPKLKKAVAAGAQ